MRIALLFCIVGATLVAAAPAKEQSVAILTSVSNGKAYRSVLLKSDLDNAPSWRHDKQENPPLSPAKAKAAAQSMLESVVPNEELKKEWSLSTITLALLSSSKPSDPKWYYIVRWSSGPQDEWQLFVLMNAKCIEPKELTPNKGIEGIAPDAATPSF